MDQQHNRLCGEELTFAGASDVFHAHNTVTSFTPEHPRGLLLPQNEITCSYYITTATPDECELTTAAQCEAAAEKIQRRVSQSSGTMTGGVADEIMQIAPPGVIVTIDRVFERGEVTGVEVRVAPTDQDL